MADGVELESAANEAPTRPMPHEGLEEVIDAIEDADLRERAIRLVYGKRLE